MMSLLPHHPEARFRTPAELVAHYRAVNRRLNTAGARFEARQRAEARIAAAIAEAEEKARDAEAFRIAMEEERRQDAEVARVRALLAGTSKNRAMRIMHETASDHGLAIADLIGSSRTRKTVTARHDAIRRVKIALPHLSLQSIGRLFGGKDHTTILHALRKGGAHG